MTSADAIRRFDILAGLKPKAMVGRWRTTGLPIGHLFDGPVEAFGWCTKVRLSDNRMLGLIELRRRPRCAEVVSVRWTVRRH